MTRVVAFVQARLGSQRLPGKVLRDLSGADPATEGFTVLDWCLHRLHRAQRLDAVVVATSTSEADDPLAAYCGERGHRVARGDLDDVLSRMVGAAEEQGADVLVRVTADCPLVDPAVVDRVVDEHLRSGADFTANRLPPPHHRTYPIGLDVEVATMDAMRRAAREATAKAHREHVMPYLYETGLFDVRVVESDGGDHGEVRWTVDTPEDLAAVGALVRHPDVRLTSAWQELLTVWQGDPTLARLNAEVRQRSARDVDDRS
jgi:spore coat polysaccharide biosynthesis protein SpsF